MRCETTANPQVFWDRTSEFLLRDPVRNHVLVTVVSGRLGRALGDDPPATYVTANKIYTAIGYRPVCEVTMYRFTSRADIVGGPLPSRSRARHHAT
jgi:hypothetical protein